MRAVILAAGRGYRLSPVTGTLPKCLARLGAATLLEWQLAVIRQAGIEQVTVVTGHRAEDVRRVCGSRADVVHNERFASTNSLYSLWLARGALQAGFVVLNCDVVFHPQLLADLLTARYEDALLACARDETIFSDEEMKVRIRAGCVVEIAKTIDTPQADAENVGIAKFGAAGAAVLVEELNRLVGAGARTEWLPAAFAGFCRRRLLHAIGTRGLPWIEIDRPEDYWCACAHVLPAIVADAEPIVVRTTPFGRLMPHV